LFVSVAWAAPPTVTTSCGEVQGRWSSQDPSLAEFLGIPYGAQPERWMPPQPAKCWQGTLSAVDSGPACPQSMVILPFQESEDCLHLDVYAPRLNKSSSDLLPVIFWIYGGSNVAGSNTMYSNLSQFALDPAFPAVVVAANYRVGTLGFLALPELSARDPRGISGNYAILDQQAALRWVQDNIHAFGGDPARVTLFGQSSGGSNIFGLAASPQSVGLFSGAISLSGSPNITMSLTQAEEQNAGLPAILGCPGNGGDVVECLLNLSFAAVQKLPVEYLSASLVPLSSQGLGTAGLLIVDGVTIPEPLLDALARPINNVSMIVQHLQCDTDLDVNATFRDSSKPEFAEWLLGYFERGNWSDPAGSLRAYQSLYESRFLSVEEASNTFLSDVGVGCGNDAVAASIATGNRKAGVQSTKGMPVYRGVVELGPSRPMRSPDGGYMHFPFHMWDYMAAAGAFQQLLPPSAPRYQPTEDDIAFGDNQRAMWLRFAYDPESLQAAPWHWQPVDAANFPQQIVTGVFNSTAPTVSAVVDYATAVCEALSAAPLNMGQLFWWVN